MKVLFIGGPGTISSSTTDSLLDKGWTVAALRRTDQRNTEAADRIQFFIGDRNNPGVLEDAIKAFTPDAIVDVCCFLPGQAAAAIAASRGRVGHYLFVSTVDVYGYPLSRLPMGVNDPKCPQVSQYARDKEACEELFMKAHREEGFPVTIFRPSYSFGPRFVLNFFSRSGGLDLVSRIRAGLPVVVPANGNGLIHASSAHNTGLMLAELVWREGTIGRSYNGAHEHAITQDEYYRLFGRAAGVEPKIVHIPTELLLNVEAEVIPDNLLSELTQFNTYFSVQEFVRDVPAFKWDWDLDQAAADYVAYHDRAKDWPTAGTSYEDRLIEAWYRARKDFTL